MSSCDERCSAGGAGAGALGALAAAAAAMELAYAQDVWALLYSAWGWEMRNEGENRFL